MGSRTYRSNHRFVIWRGQAPLNTWTCSSSEKYAFVGVSPYYFLEFTTSAADYDPNASLSYAIPWKPLNCRLNCNNCYSYAWQLPDITIGVLVGFMSASAEVQLLLPRERMLLRRRRRQRRKQNKRICFASAKKKKNYALRKFVIWLT